MGCPTRGTTLDGLGFGAEDGCWGNCELFNCIKMDYLERNWRF